MFERNHMSIAEQLHSLLTGETVWMDTDFADCEVRLLENMILICTPDCRRFEIKATPSD